MKNPFNRDWFAICAGVFLYIGITYGQNGMAKQDFTVLDKPADEMMKNYLTGIVESQFAKRDSLLVSMRGVNDWEERSETIRTSLKSWTGAFPEKTPLNGRIVGRVEKKDYAVEKVLFESRPNYYVSANLYIPKNFSGKRPALVNLIGHSALGKADERYQRIGLSMVRKGFVVLTIDQYGQGERKVNEYSQWGIAPTNAHQINGIRAFLSGTHVFNYMVWDVIRAIDYLVSRTEVDEGRISMTGSSGGGMMTTYVLPFEDRVSVAVPTCNPNTWLNRVHANLGTDHEQVFFGAFGKSIDPRGDPLFTHVPKPLLLNTTTDDVLNPPRGVWDLNTWLYKSYSSYNEPEKLSTTMVKAGHAYNKEQREITYSWVQRWNGVDSGDYQEKEDYLIEKEEDLWVTEDGNVFNLSGSIRLHALILDYMETHRAKWDDVTTAKALMEHKVDMHGLTQKVLHNGFDTISYFHEFKKEKIVGEIVLKPFVIEPEPGIVLPGTLIEPMKKGPNPDVVLYVDENGKSGIIDNMKFLKGWLDKGNIICTVDLRGMGETSPDMANKFWDFLAGRPIYGQRVKDVLTIVEWLKESEIKAGNIGYWGVGMCSLYGAFAGVLSNDISSFILERPLVSFENLVKVELPAYNHEVLLPGILENFDMEQVYQALCPRTVLILNPLSGDKKYAGDADVGSIKGSVGMTYKSLEAENAWRMVKAGVKEREEAISHVLNTN